MVALARECLLLHNYHRALCYLIDAIHAGGGVTHRLIMLGDVSILYGIFHIGLVFFCSSYKFGSGGYYLWRLRVSKVAYLVALSYTRYDL